MENVFTKGAFIATSVHLLNSLVMFLLFFFSSRRHHYFHRSRHSSMKMLTCADAVHPVVPTDKEV